MERKRKLAIADPDLNAIIVPITGPATTASLMVCKI